MTNIRTQTLGDAEALVNGPRQEHYGEPAENFAAIAQMWTAYLGTAVAARDVANMMALLKIARLRNGPHYDSSVDTCGYMALAAELSGVQE